ncbi:lipopolysaccharide biosynthesis protein [Ligilactobacillus ruminis]|uniref:lipopolysaccharide biosynthesis protein n=1 Tax=Ligilactobacillus ruminis TaxID=1623 RepID=UPI003F988DC6
METKKKTNEINNTKRAAIAYIIANLLNKGLSYLTLPIFTRLMTTNQMGVVTTFSSWQNIIYPIVTLSLTSGSINIAFLEYKDRRNEYESNILTISTITGALVLLFTMLFVNPLSKLLLLPKGLVVLLAVINILNPTLDIWYARQRYEFKYTKVLGVSVISSLSSTIISILAVYYLRNAHNLAVVRLISQYCPILIICALFYILIMHKGKSYFNKGIWLFALELSLPLIIHTLSKNILDLSDRLMIAKMCGNSDAGIYGTVYGISSMALILWSAMNSALIPDMFGKLENKEYSHLNKLIIDVMVIFGMFSLMITLFAPEVLRILTTEQYYKAVYIMPAIAGGVYLTCVYNVFGNFLLYRKKSLNIMFATLGAAIVNIIFNFFAIRMFGYMAAAYTTMISFVALAIFQGVMVRNSFDSKIIDFSKILLVSTVFVLLELLCLLVYHSIIMRFGFILLVALFLASNHSKIVAMFRR